MPPPIPPGGAPGAFADPSAPTATPGLATAALVCGIVGLVLFVLFVVSVVALVLGLIAASKAKRAPGPNSGLGRARAGWIMGLIGVVAFAGFVVAAASEDDDVSVDRLRPGDCVDRTDDTDIVEEMPAQNCDEPHDAEVYLVEDVPLDSDEYPGKERVGSEVEAVCLGDGFTDYVGIPYERSILDVYALSPSEESWERGDRAAVCMAVMPDGSSLTAPVKGTGD